MIEIIAMTPEDARCIEDCGADRIELISAFSEGGLTPSCGMIERVIQAVNIPVNVMIRPHAKSFTYSREEIGIMKRDIAIARELGANGVAFGVLQYNSKICEENMEELIQCCGSLDITFHRAIDELPDIIGGIRMLSKCPGIKTVLTSGGKGDIYGNIPVIKEMQNNSGHIRVMVGGGLNFENIRSMVEGTGAADYHFGTAVRYDRSALADIDPKKLKELVKLLTGSSIINRKNNHAFREAE